MPAYGGGSAADQYLVQRIQGASPEQLAAMLLEGSNRFLTQAIQAMRNRDIPAKARYINRVSAIIEELAIWLDLEKGDELATNLGRIYDWWLQELFAASQANEPERLEHIGRQMLEIRGAWETVGRQKQPNEPVTTKGVDGLVG